MICKGIQHRDQEGRILGEKSQMITVEIYIHWNLQFSPGIETWLLSLEDFQMYDALIKMITVEIYIHWKFQNSQYK